MPSIARSRCPGAPARNRVEQSLRVRMLRRLEDLPHRTFLDDPSRVHHGHAIGMTGDDAEVVRDEQQREMKLLLHLLQQVENLRLNRHVERGRRFVGDEQQRLAGERDGDEHALAHASRQLMRIVAQPARRIWNPHRLEQLDRLGLRARRACAFR